LLQLGKNPATTTTQQVAMDATPLAVWNVDTIALPTIRALVLLYHVETESVQALNCATITTQQVAMDATPLAVWSVDTVALLAIGVLVLLYCVETESVQALNCATTTTQQAATDAALSAPLRQDGNASRIVIASIQRAFG
jgi:hypothetical protein